MEGIATILGFASEMFKLDFKFGEAKWFNFFAELFRKLAETFAK